MKHLKNLFAAALTLVVAMALSVTAFAAGTGSITITPPSGVASDATNTYKIYKVFDADASADGSSVSYKVMASKAGKALPTGFVTDAAGNVIHGTKAEDGTITPSTATELTADEIASIAAYVEGDTPVATPTTTGTAAATASNLPNGYYFITTSTGSVVTINTAKPNATVNDKNTVPEVDKKITGEVKIDDKGLEAIQEVGKDVDYESTITLGKGFKGYVFHDTMTHQVLKGTPVVKAGSTTFAAGTDYTLTVAADNASFDIEFNDNGAIKNLVAGDTITITYVGTVTSDALTVDTAHNTAYVSYGDKDSNNKTPEKETDVYNATIGVEKFDGSTEEPLEGAGFKLKNAEGKYYKMAADKKSIEWVAAEADGDEKFTGADGKLTEEFKGLAAGTYTLVETTVPSGYNKAADTDVTIANNSVDLENLVQAAAIENNKGSVLPSTGGMGTTLFYIVGGLMVAGAAIALIAKNRVAKIEG